ncbi:CCAAT/enhancer-binding protein zeta [Onthophagus taurus]|uniref:CCAAT/enhancer-binding protein zeta n=1 Tax=Onthophagus taurus TaxID=166361 RepID=UPI0039BEA4CC
MKFKTKSKKEVKEDVKDNLDDGFGEYTDTKKWYDEISEDPGNFKLVSDQVWIDLKDEAKKCWDSEVANYNIKNSKSNSNFRWMKTATSKGTVSDKVAAGTILIQNNPVATLDMLNNMVSLVKVGKKRECIIVMETLSELFLSDLLRPNNKLKPFYQRPIGLLNELSSGNAVTRRKYLAYWYFEDQLKETYTTFVLALNKVAQDTVDHNKEKAIAAMYKLLAGNPEQEKNLLSYIVNKLGDPSQKVASKAIYCLTQLLLKHSNMQEVVLLEVEKLVFRQNISQRAQYYGLCFLSQFYLNHESSNVARKLIEVYFAFFKLCVAKGDVDSRMMSALLMGVNRAYPYAKLELNKISEHIDTMYRVVHVANFNVALHTLTLLYQVSDYANDINDRFYSALYKKLLDPKLPSTTHQAILLNLIFKALSKDKEINRIMSFIKRLLQLTLSLEPSFACGMLYLISQLCKDNPNLLHLTLKESESKELSQFDDDGDEKYEDVGETVIKIEDDDNLPGEKIDEEASEKKIEEEVDIKPDIDELNKKIQTSSSGWVHRTQTIKKEHDLKVYNPLNRNPLYSGVQYTAYLELLNLQNHYHPSVALFAEKILKGEPITYSGDPLQDFTLIRFLDRFVFKNPKKIEEMKQGAHPTFGKRKHYLPLGLRSISVTSEKYLNQNERKIPVDELFVYKFLQKRRENKSNEDDDDDSDADSVASDEFEEMLDKMQTGKVADDDDIDFMNEIGNNLKKGKKTANKDNDDEDKDDDDDDIDLDDEDIDMDDSNDENDDNEDFDGLKMNDDDDELIGDLDDDDLSDMVFDSEDEDDGGKKEKKKINKKKGDDLDGIFASAEEFASLLEDEGNSKRAPGGSSAVSNKDKAGLKQIAWEEKRNHWLHGYKKAVSGKSFNFQSKRKVSSQKGGSKKFGGKSKKQRTK